MTTQQDTSNPEESRRYGRIVLYWVLGFFLTFIAVDSFFVYKAMTNQPVVLERIDGQ